MYAARLTAKFPKPTTIFFVILSVIFTIEAVLMFLLPVVLPSNDNHIQDLADSFLLSLLSAPFIWFFVVRPLQAAAVAEITKHQVALEYIVDAVINFNGQGTIESLNAAAEKMFGYVAGEIIGQDISHIIPDIEASSEIPSRTGDTSALDFGFRVNRETTGCRKDGTGLPALISISRLQLGGRSTYAAIIHDISERKHAETALQEQKDFSLQLVQESAVPCFVLAPDHTVLVWNKACEELTGLKGEELIGSAEQWKAFYDHKRPTLADLVIDGQGQEIGGHYGSISRSPFAEDGLQSEGWYPNLGGKGRYIFFDAVPVRNAKGELLAVIETLEEITERKMAEESLRTSERQRLKSKAELTVQHEQLSLLYRQLEQAHAELKETQAQLIQQEKMASIGQLAAGVAHEINNPTGFIMSNLGTLQKYIERLSVFVKAQSDMITVHGIPDADENLAGLQKQLKIDRIVGDLPSLIAESLDGAERIKKIAQDLKSFSRADEEECKTTSLIDCIESTISIVWNELKYKATLKKEFGDLPPIRCYPQQLSQVIMNLLVNASHAIEKQGEITVSVWQENDSACLAIADTGSGIPEEIRSRIFEPFFTTKEVGKGTGLGLPISYDIVKKHGGEIIVESTVGEGTTFTVRLPLNGVQGS